MEQNDTFEIGLVMAGAVSAGAYTAGVVDYLQEALRHYEKVRRKFAEEHPGEALHNVQIRVTSGASAGGMTGTMLLSSMMDKAYRPMSGFDPSTVTRPDIEANVFYRSWVDTRDGIDISYFLDNGDVTGKAPLKSLLNCERLDRIADGVLARPRILQPYDYIPKRIDHFLSVFNLCGVPYTVGFEESSAEYGQVNHSDMMHFVHDSDPQPKPDPNEILLAEDQSASLDPNWKMLRQTTLATGAFPIALEARELSRDPQAYSKWRWWVPQSDSKGRCKALGRCFSLQEIAPDWSGRGRSDYSFVCVDGGVANNEPLEVARRTLAGDDQFNPRGKDTAKRAVIMVDPFPSEPFVETFTSGGQNLFGIASRIFGSLKEQARFKPEELEMASNPDIFSRFIIAPSRKGAGRGEELASASMGAFGGFLSEKFRQHDFQLGRKNCQSFLMKNFFIGIDNPLVNRHLEWFEAHGCVIERRDEKFVQIVPMVDLPGSEITKPVVPIPYDSVAITREELGTVMKLIDRRIEKVIEKSYLVSNVIDGIMAKISSTSLRWLAKSVVKLLRNAISDYLVSKASEKIRKIMVEDLEKRGLLK